MSNCEIQIQPELAIIEVEQENDHTKLMNAFKKVQQKLDYLIERKKSSKISQSP